ncbi:MAG TPA: FeoA family protein [Methylomusa anaerophila]|uniref:FeoA domain protein n=1 Tax=Methylomusa anaerophila TaxID=1930071 RepID=A0A348AEH1_9FIRM|nr:FeoA family protein [Methylomusa anaerophila]BBB89469.1 FeoA domain protein [Methylomusa anaerophila]HML89701.1 FeoA family protein [Methylomusa anaerophila]
MPIHLANRNRKWIVTDLGGSREERSRLSDLGFIPGTPVYVVSCHPTALVISVRGSRIMLNHSMARHIHVA